VRDSCVRSIPSLEFQPRKDLQRTIWHCKQDEKLTAMGTGFRDTQRSGSTIGQPAGITSTAEQLSPHPKRSIRKLVSTRNLLPTRSNSVRSFHRPFWPNKSTPSQVGNEPRTYRRKHVPIEISPSLVQSVLKDYPLSPLPVDFDRRPSLPILGSQGKNIDATNRFLRRKHVPILIPGIPQPFDDEYPTPKRPQALDIGNSPHSSVSRSPLCGEGSRAVPDIPTRNPQRLAPRVDCRSAAFKMSSSQTSLSRDSGQEGKRDSPQNGQQVNPNTTPQSTGASPPLNQYGTPSTIAGTSGPTNLSGLVCNVHRTTGREPHALVGATTTVLGDKLYVFGGRVLSRTRPQLTSDLYELDLIRRHWTKLETTGDVPPPRYFHSVCALGDSKLVCYGGMSPAAPTSNLSTSSSAPSQNSDPQPEVVVMSDIHIYDVPTRTWMSIPTAETPQGRYAHCATILPSSAVFASANAPLSAIHHNPASSNPHQGSIGVALDGAGGAEMVVVGGQDSSNHYIEQISVFNLRSLKWTATNSLGRSCGAYRSVVAPLTGLPVGDIGKKVEGGEEQSSPSSQDAGSSMLIYSNYNFLDVKLELQIRLPDGRLSEKTMYGTVSPPGLRFPNGGVIDGHFVVSGTYLTSSKQEYALWALDLKSLTWGRIDAGGSVFGQGSWNRGVLWNRRNTFVILGNKKRSLVEDYNHRRINFSHICMVELEAFGLYDNPRKASPTSGYISVSSPALPPPLQAKLTNGSRGGRPYSEAAEELGHIALSLRELADMDLLAIGGERVPVNSHLLATRWGPYFVQLLRDSASTHDGVNDAATLRPNMHSQASRNSSITITPSAGTTYSGATTLTNGKNDPLANLEPPEPRNLTPNSRPRTLYLPHTHLTLQILVHYLYTSSLPPINSPLCTPQILCSLLQLARPYQVDGLLEATVERLHQVLDGRNAAAVFNAAAMAAGGGRGTGFIGSAGTLDVLNEVNSSAAGTNAQSSDSSSFSAANPSMAEKSANTKPSKLRINTNLSGTSSLSNDDRDSALSSASTSTSTSFSATDSEFTNADPGGPGRGEDGREREVWTGDVSSVIGLQKRGLRGLMEGRRLRERGGTQGSSGRPPAAVTADGTRMGLGIA
jgi:hypothetical protein